MQIKMTPIADCRAVQTGQPGPVFYDQYKCKHQADNGWECVLLIPPSYCTLVDLH